MTEHSADILPLFEDDESTLVQPTGSPWIVSDEDPATVPVPLQVVIMSVDGPFTQRDRKLWTFLLHAVFDELGEKPIHSLPIKHINDVFRQLGGEHSTSWIWESARRLAKTTIEFEVTYDDERYLGVAAIFGANVPAKGKRGSELHFHFPPNLIPIIKQPLRFARLRVHFMLGLSGKYAVTLYEILEAYVNRRDGQCRVTIDELRRWLKVPDGKYPDWKNFRHRVLRPAIDQINADPLGAGFSVEYEPIRKGRFYDEIIFKLTKTQTRKSVEKLLRDGAAKRAAVHESMIPAWADEQARKVAQEKGFDFYALRSEWLDYANSQSAELKNPGAAFVGFCKKKKTLR
jgi:hypothetical protein